MATITAIGEKAATAGALRVQIKPKIGGATRGGANFLLDLAGSGFRLPGLWLHRWLLFWFEEMRSGHLSFINAVTGTTHKLLRIDYPCKSSRSWIFSKDD